MCKKDLINKTVEDKVIKTENNPGKTRQTKLLGGKGKLTGKVIDNLS